MKPRGCGPLATLVLLALAVLMAGGAWLAWGWKLQPVDAETQGVRAAAEGAIRTLHLVDPRPRSINGLPPGDVAAIRAQVSADVERYFTPELQGRYLPMLLSAVDQLGGLDPEASVSIDWERAAITGDRASISFAEDTSMTIHDEPGHMVAGTWTDQMTLVRQDGHWRVDSWLTDCEFNCP